jgi:hypothetical protein
LRELIAKCLKEALEDDQMVEEPESASMVHQRAAAFNIWHKNMHHNIQW